jgi:chromosome segregation ATPase
MSFVCFVLVHLVCSCSLTSVCRSVGPLNVLQVSQDTEQVARLEEQLGRKQAEEEELGRRLQEMETDLRRLNVELEETRKEWKTLEQRKNYKAKAGARIEQKKRNLRKTMAEASLEQERTARRGDVKPCVRQMVKSVQQLQSAIREVERGQLAIDLARLGNQPMEELVEERQAALDTAMESLQGLRKEAALAGRDLEERLQALSVTLREAKAVTGSSGKEPPAEVVTRWETEKLPTLKEEIEVMITELQVQADCMDTVDPAAVRDYKLLKETIEELVQDIQRREQQQRDSEHNIEQVSAPFNSMTPFPPIRSRHPGWRA